jgi:hypothetical protein
MRMLLHPIPVINGDNPPGTICLLRSIYVTKLPNKKAFLNIVAPDPVIISLNNHGCSTCLLTFMYSNGPSTMPRLTPPINHVNSFI